MLMLLFLIISYFVIPGVLTIKCHECNEETCGRSDSSGTCTGRACYKTVLFDTAQGGVPNILLKGCLKDNRTLWFSDECTTENFKLVQGMSWVKKCFCRNEDLCNKSPNILTGKVQAISLLLVIITFFYMK